VYGPVAYSNHVASGAVKVGPGELFGVTLTGGSDAATLILYDEIAGSGTIICKLSAAANTSTSLSLPMGASFGVGCYAVLTGTAPSASIFYV